MPTALHVMSRNTNSCSALWKHLTQGECCVNRVTLKCLKSCVCCITTQAGHNCLNQNCKDISHMVCMIPRCPFQTPLNPSPRVQETLTEFFLCFVYFLHIAPCHFGQVLHSVMDGTCLQHVTEIMNTSKILNTISKDPT